MAKEGRARAPAAGEPWKQMAFQMCMNTATYPLHLVRTLVQVEHEPLPATLGKTWFGLGKKAHFLPNCFVYSSYIRRTEGFTGMYKGLVPHLLEAALQQASSRWLSDLIPAPPKKAKESETSSNYAVAVATDIARSACIRGAVITIGHPFHVVNIRMIVYYVGRESAYASFRGAIRAIYENEGVGGFFSGLTPRLVGELLGLIGYELLLRGILKLAEAGGSVDERDELEMYGRTLVNYLVRIATYPFFLTSTLAIVDGSSMAAATAVPLGCGGDWLRCLRRLYATSENMRGNSLFNRTAKCSAVRDTRL